MGALNPHEHTRGRPRPGKDRDLPAPTQLVRQHWVLRALAPDSQLKPLDFPGTLCLAVPPKLEWQYLSKNHRYGLFKSLWGEAVLWVWVFLLGQDGWTEAQAPGDGTAGTLCLA